jgi:hypothetical protein
MRKSYSLFLGVMLKKGVVDDGDDDDEWELVEPIISPCDGISGYLGLGGKKLV